MDTNFPAILEPDPSNLSELSDRIFVLQPKLQGKEPDFRKFSLSLYRLLKNTDPVERERILDEARETIQGMPNGIAKEPEVALKFACSILVDILAQGWDLALSKSRVKLISPGIRGVSRDELKRRIRQGHLLERNAQLRQPSVREFIKSMEQRRLGPKGWVSIFSLMRDGRELTHVLRAASTEKNPEARAQLLHRAVSPYLQVVDASEACEFTGVNLMDIWRYFRHTWTNTYKPLPGRSMMILVRDAAAPLHPVIGIAALGSSMAQQTQRDCWIGWDSDTFLKQITVAPTARLCRWIHDSIDRHLAGLYVRDFLTEKVVDQRELRSPTAEVIPRLMEVAEKAAALHRLDPNAARHKKATSSFTDADWEESAKLQLFRSKRARTLALLLGIRASLQAAGLNDASAGSLKKVLANARGRHAIRQLIRLVKAEHAGVDMMDLIVCGSVAPYNVLLGGKLICLLLSSPEIVVAYGKRYQEQASVIASSMKGAKVIRPPKLVLICTTSLYGVGSSQYNRIKVPLGEIGGKQGQYLSYLNLGESKGYGSYHFSQASIDYLETVLGRAGGGRKVNSIFGEGVNPLMRKIRDGLTVIGLPADELLNHGNTRVVYGVALADNFREILTGIETKPRYLLSIKNPKASTEALAEYWRRRWLDGRITRDEVLAEVNGHTLSYPITHGARVVLPEIDSGELGLFV